MTNMERLREMLRQTIDAKRLTIVEIARMAGCSRQHIHNLLNGDRDISMSLAERLAEICGSRLEIKRGRKKIPA